MTTPDQHPNDAANDSTKPKRIRHRASFTLAPLTRDTLKELAMITGRSESSLLDSAVALLAEDHARRAARIKSAKPS